MAALSDITIMTERRCCFVREERALFHRWIDRAEVVAPSPLQGGHGGGEIKWTMALVEFEDGHIEYVDPVEVRFCKAPEFTERAWA